MNVDHGRRRFRITFGKLILHPLAVGVNLLGMTSLGLGIQDNRLLAAAIILAAMPVMAIYLILAQGYGEARTASLAMFVIAAASFLTISLVLALTVG